MSLRLSFEKALVISNNLLIILSLVLIVVAGGSANLRTAFVGSALGMAGNQSFKYFYRGTVKSVFYGDMEQLIDSVEKSMNDSNSNYGNCPYFTGKYRMFA